jgi:hypothetical protein
VTAFSCYIENFKFQIDCEEILYFRYCSIWKSSLLVQF